MKRITMALALAVFCGLPIAAVNAEIIEEEPDLTDNTGPLEGVDSGTVTSVDVVSETEQAETGTIKGELTIFKKSDGSGYEIFSSEAKVEAITADSEGWVGKIAEGSSSLRFTPAGRPELECPAESISGWYGPCKIPEVN